MMATENHAHASVTPDELMDIDVVCPDPERQRLMVAYHEAGHAVVGRALGGLCHAVEVYVGPDGERGDGDVLGCCTWWHLEATSCAVRSLAAPIAMWWVGRGAFPVAPTWEAFREYAQTLTAFNHDAAVLVRSVSFEDDPAGVYADAWEQATRMVESLWADIERVARELDRRGTLTGGEFLEVLGALTKERAHLLWTEREAERKAEVSRQNRKDNEDFVRWKSPGGWLWLEERGYYEDPPDPILLLVLERGDHDEELEPIEVQELIADLRERLKDYPDLLEGSDDGLEDFGSPAPF